MGRPSLRKRVFAWLLKKGDSFNHELYKNHKRELLHNVRGTVLEVGPGSGINLDYLNKDVVWIGVEPNTAFEADLLDRARKENIQARLIAGDAESIPLPNESVDAVLCTLVLCSVPSPANAVSEMKRVLKPGGSLIFIEHVAAVRGTTLRNFQNFFNPLNQLVADGCNCNRETWATLEQGGFQKLDLVHIRIHGTLKLHSPHIKGIAIK